MVMLGTCYGLVSVNTCNIRPNRNRFYDFKRIIIIF